MYNLSNYPPIWSNTKIYEYDTVNMQSTMCVSEIICQLTAELIVWNMYTINVKYGKGNNMKVVRSRRRWVDIKNKKKLWQNVIRRTGRKEEMYKFIENDWKSEGTTRKPERAMGHRLLNARRPTGWSVANCRRCPFPNRAPSSSRCWKRQNNTRWEYRHVRHVNK